MGQNVFVTSKFTACFHFPICGTFLPFDAGIHHVLLLCYDTARVVLYIQEFLLLFHLWAKSEGGWGWCVTARNVLYSSSQEKWLSQLTNSEVHFADCRIYWLPFTYPTLVSVPSLVSHHTGSWQHTGTCHCHALSVVHLSPWCCRSLSHLNESKDIVW